MTPVLTTQLIGSMVPVDGMALFKSTLQVRCSLLWGALHMTQPPSTLSDWLMNSLCQTRLAHGVCQSV
jgi:hypothetical protein